MRNDPMYEIAKQICHEEGIDWRHPVTGVNYPAPKRTKAAVSYSPPYVPTRKEKTHER